jgi:subtilisin family serine protease
MSARRNALSCGLALGLSLAAVATACSLPPTQATPTMPAEGSFAPGELLVEFKEGTTEARIKEVHKAVGAEPLEEIVPQVWRAGVPPGSEARTIPRFLAFPEVRFAEFNARIHTNMVGAFRPATLPKARTTQVKPNDPRLFKDTPGLPAQWALSRIGLCNAGDCAVWDRTQGQGVKVAVIDTGVDLTHPDLAPNLLNLQGSNIIDPKASADDDFGHGTHVAGIIAAAMNNQGVVGIAPQAKIMPIRVLSVDGGDTAGLIRGLDFAVRNGASVVNLSLGSAQTSEIEARQMSQAIQKNVVVVAAAGNEALAGNPLEYPASIPGVISVAATRPATDDVEVRFREHAPFSNYNPFVAISAPGVDILSTIPKRFFIPTANPADDANAYAYASGTSMASPIIAGVVALMLSANPQLKPADVRKRLQGSAADLGDTGFDDLYGWGLVNVPAAMP